jgi:hypothetical protein
MTPAANQGNSNLVCFTYIAGLLKDRNEAA